MGRCGGGAELLCLIASTCCGDRPGSVLTQFLSRNEIISPEDGRWRLPREQESAGNGESGKTLIEVSSDTTRSNPPPAQIRAEWGLRL